MQPIAGRVTGAKAGLRVVLFARSGTWWVQPFSNEPFTALDRDFTWKASTHMGTEYAALLVKPGFTPPKTTDVLPPKGGAVLAVATVEGKPSGLSPTLVPKTIQFSGYQWEVLQLPSDSGGVMHLNSASNAWTDERGWLHLRIAREASEWSCAEISLTRSLGYGAYSFVLHEGPELDPGAVLGMFTWDTEESGQNHREFDIEVSQWGDPAGKNSQFTIQPYYVPGHVFRFDSPRAFLVHSFQWQPGRVSFKTVRASTEKSQHIVAEQVFTSGIPSPGGERVHINLYTYGKSRTPQRRGNEVVIEKFEYLP